jgi:RNA polymerase sigma factor (sigma-70 family)
MGLSSAVKKDTIESLGEPTQGTTKKRNVTKDVPLGKKKSTKSKAKAKKSGPLLPPEEIERLIVDHQEDGLRMAWKLLNRWRIKLPADDVVSIVGIALCEAASRFDPSYETAFRTFFFYHLRGVLIKEVTSVINDRNMMGLRSLPGDADGEAYSSYYVQQSNAALVEKKTPEHFYSKRQVEELCQAAIERLDDLQQEVIIRYFSKEQSIVSIAEELGYCRCHLSRVKNRALKALAKYLEPVNNPTAKGRLPELIGKPAKLKMPSKREYTGGRGRRRNVRKAS